MRTTKYSLTTRAFLESALVAALFSVGSSAMAECQAVPETVPGPELAAAAHGLRGWVIMDQPVGGIAALNVATGEEVVVRPPGGGIGTVHAISGPDLQGRIAFVEDHMLEKRHLIKLIGVDGLGERLVLERKGDALWANDGDQIGDHLALSPLGGRVAFVRDLSPVKIPSSHAWVTRGLLTVLDAETGSALPVQAPSIDEQLCWFPDGRQIVYTDLLERQAAALLLSAQAGTHEPFASSLLEWEQVPAVHVLDIESGRTEVVYVGMRGGVSPDGTQVLVCDLEQRWRVVDLTSHSVRALVPQGGINPGPIAWLDGRRALYWAAPTEGASLGVTEHNSPLVGPKPMRTLKVFDLRSGGFSTLVPSIDPRRRVGFGIGP